MPYILPPDFKPVRTGLTANPLQTQAAGTPLTFGTNRVDTSVAVGDSCTLPVGTGSGRTVVVQNKSANQIFIFPDVGGTINAIGVNGAQSISTGQMRAFIDVSPLNWGSLTS